MMPGFWKTARQGFWGGQAIGLPFAGNVYYVGSGAPSGVGIRRVDTIAAALSLMISRDVLVLGPQEHAEGNLSIPATKPNIVIMGAGPRGSCFIEPATAAHNGLEILADDVTLINVGVANGSGGTYGLSVGSQTVSPDRFRSYGCKFEGTGIAARLYGAGDVLLDDCEFAWANTGLQFRANNNGFVTQAFIRGSRFHNNATACISESANQQEVDNLQLWNNLFDQLEDGTEPTDFILLQHNGNTGVIGGNIFALATNATAKLTIGTGLMWAPNGTEAGWSTARPA